MWEREYVRGVRGMGSTTASNTIKETKGKRRRREGQRVGRIVNKKGKLKGNNGRLWSQKVAHTTSDKKAVLSQR